MYKIINKKALNSTVTMMDIEAPFVAKKAQAGQFIILRVDEEGERIFAGCGLCNNFHWHIAQPPY
jgi:ferredoxin--NADP+ reductase